jgi:type IV secretory pathway TrbL component
VNVEALATIVVCAALIACSALAGISVMKRGVASKGATGTLGSVLSMMDPATGAPTRQEAAAAREEQKQQRHEAAESGKGFGPYGVYGGKVTIQGPPAPGKPAPGAPVKRTDIF